ncbi:MAG: acetyltransferase [Gemmatimonadota bacterium]|nr:acetyltransferase [Gemmatimonadota bacterium]
MKHVVIIGAGGHGREVLDILRHQMERTSDLSVLGFIDETPDTAGKMIDGAEILGDWDWFETADLDNVYVVCAVGKPAVAARLAERANSLDLSFINVISPLAYISPFATLAHGVAVFPNVIVNTGVSVGSHCILNVGSTVSHDTKIGRYSNINPGAHLAGNVSIGEGCYIGMAANVIQGTSIGEGTVIGAGATVIRDTPANVTAVGVPARVIRKREQDCHAR